MAELFKYTEKEEVYKACADVIQEAIEDLSGVKDKIVLAVPGGRSVEGIFSHLKNKNLPWEKVHIFMVDERLTDPESENSNYKLLKVNLIEPLAKKDKLPGSNVHPFIYDELSDDLGVAEYAEELKMLGGKFDIILLSSGEDGHIGALYPNHHSIQNESDYFITMRDSPKPPKGRMTSSKNLLGRSQVALLVFLGEEKKEAYDNFNNLNVSIEECPSKIIDTIENSFVFTDLVE
ncbi:MAG: 6-phosphogluconolactonase [Nanoarchaeota archaeon]